MKVKYRYVFVVLVYKNIEVLKDFFLFLKTDNYKVIVVNSFYDAPSLKECKEVSLANGADFIPIENKGYGYGNNIGVEYAMEHYNYDYLILSNSDIHIKDLDVLSSFDEGAAVIAPYIHLPAGKVQNPNIPWRIPFLFRALKLSYDNNWKFLLLFTHIVTRTCRELFKLYGIIVKRSCYKIYSCHGSFIIFTKEAVNLLRPPFNDKMFLYNEELYLAENCRLKGVPIFYCPSIDVLHLEGASSGGFNGFERNKESYHILYEWIKENNIIR